jgi:exosortase/archaeosortase family protein
MKSSIGELLERPLVNFILAIAAAIFLIFFDFSIFKILVEHEILRYSLLYKPHWFVKDFLIFFFLSSMIFVLIHKEIREKEPYFHLSLPFLLLHFMLAGLFYSLMHFITHRLALFQANPALFSLLWSAVGIAMGLCAVLTFVRPKSLASILMTYKKEWFISFLFAGVFLALPHTLFDFWQPLSRFVGTSVVTLLSLTYKGTSFEPHTFMLGIREFAVYVYKPCSGVEGIRLFVFLFTAVIIFDWKRISKVRVLFVYTVGVVVMFVADVIRIYLILVLGFEIFKRYGYPTAYRIALEQFHSNFGWLFYTVVIVALFKVLYPFMIGWQEKNEGPEK